MFPRCFYSTCVCLSNIIHKHNQVFCGQVDVAFTIKSSTAGSTAGTSNGCMWLKPPFDNAYHRYYQLLKLSTISSVANPHRLALCGLKQSIILPNALQCFFATYLSAKCARVFGMLSYLHLFNHLSQRRTITGPIFTGDSNLLGSLRLEKKKKISITPISMSNTRVHLVPKRYANPKIKAAHNKIHLGSDTSNSVPRYFSCLFKPCEVYTLAIRPLRKKVICGSC